MNRNDEKSGQGLVPQPHGGAIRPGSPPGGNPNTTGRPPGKSWSTIINELLSGKVSEAARAKLDSALAKEVGTDYRRAVVASAIERALRDGGNGVSAAANKAAEFLRDTDEEGGKPIQTNRHEGGDPDRPIFVAELTVDEKAQAALKKGLLAQNQR